MGKFAARIFEDKKPRPNSNVAVAMRSAGVQRSSDLVRILALPRRHLDLTAVLDATEAFKTAAGELSLRPVQSAALLEGEECGGLVGSIGVGHGKTLILLLMAEALQAERAVLIVPPELKKQLLERDLPFYGKHFQIPTHRIAGIVSYSELSVPVRVRGIPKHWQWLAHLAVAIEHPLAKLDPDALVCDEVHRIRRKESARARAVFGWMEEHPETKFVGLSGSLSKGSIRDYAPIVWLALRKNAPVPLSFTQLAAWADALDDPRGDKPTLNPGALWLLCAPPGATLDDGTLASIATGLDEDSARSVVRDGYRRRLVETPGFVSTPEQAFDGSLYIRMRRPKVPAKLAKTLADLRETWEIGDLQFSEAMHLSQAVRRLGTGFYYEPVWPGGKRDDEYAEAKRAWSKEVRDRLKWHPAPGMTTELNLRNAALSGRWKSETFAAWEAVRERFPSSGPPKRAVWIDDYLVKDALAWAKDAGSGIIWVSDVAFGEAVAAAGGFPFFGEGRDAGDTNAKASPIIVCTAKSQGEGKNLQTYSRNLITRPFAGADTWEQVLGRTHRPGQEEDEVWFDVEAPIDEADDAIAGALKSARALKEREGNEQKLLLATFI
jgi:hypothetical protein